MTGQSPRERPWIVLVGGFLGSGKTSLILAAVRILQQRGLRCAVILNDQGDELVDTRHAETNGILSREVTGGCFCCKLSSLLTVIEELKSQSLDVIFAEPVGSCTDISAKVLGPLREDFDAYRLAPFTVLVDPTRAAALQGPDADSNMSFLFQKQLQEADLVVMTKADLYPRPAAIPGVDGRSLSAKTGRGVSEWLDEIFVGSLAAGATTLEIDYEQYARAEAALAWLNLSFTFTPSVPMSPALVLGPLLDNLDEALTAAGISIAHLKIFDRSPSGWVKAAICANRETPSVEGNLDASPSARHELLLNLRAIGQPSKVQIVVEDQMSRLPGSCHQTYLSCFSPAPPKPERRIPASSPENIASSI